MKIGLISDIHSNIHALKVVLDDLGKEGVERILVAGDLIGYYYWPREVVELLMTDQRISCIRGNHEDILKEVLEDQRAAERYRRKYGSGYETCRKDLSSEQLSWLLALPREMRLEIGGLSFHVEHGTLGSSDKYLYPDAPVGELLKNHSGLDFTVFGHTHYPFLHEHRGKYLLNPGSVGQPRDVGGLASYVIVNADNRVVRFKRIEFDTEAVVVAALREDPEQGYLAAIMRR